MQHIAYHWRLQFDASLCEIFHLRVGNVAKLKYATVDVESSIFCCEGGWYKFIILKEKNTRVAFGIHYNFQV